jgi:hypothetical protein
MKSLAKPKGQSGQAIIQRILNEIEAIYLTTPTYAMQFEWVTNNRINGCTGNSASENILPVRKEVGMRRDEVGEIA